MSGEEENDTNETEETAPETPPTPPAEPQYLTAEALTKLLDEREAAKAKSTPVKRTAPSPAKKAPEKKASAPVEDVKPEPRKRSGASRGWFGSRAD